jgi:hypothetical protein
MPNTTTLAGLRETIRDLEARQSTEWLSVKKDTLSAYESFKLINIIKSTLKQTLTAPELKANIADTAIGLTTGFLAKKVLIGKTGNPFKKVLGLILEMTVANKVANNADAIKTVAGILLNKLTPSKQNTVSK